MKGHAAVLHPGYTSKPVWTEVTVTWSCVSGGRRERQGSEKTILSPPSSLQRRVEDQAEGMCIVKALGVGV